MVVTKYDFIKVILATAAVFLVGLGMGYMFDTSRLNYLSGELQESTLETESFVVGQAYLDAVEERERFCSLMDDQIYETAEKTQELGTDLQNFGSAGMFRQGDYDYLESRYYLYEIRFMLMVERYREECDQDVVSIMYFFSDNIQSQRQGNVLTEFREANQGQVFVFSFDMESDNTSAVNMIKQDHNVTATPTLVINQDRKLEGYTPQTELRQTVQEYINLDDGDS
jgi:hypothetical protein